MGQETTRVNCPASAGEVERLLRGPAPGAAGTALLLKVVILAPVQIERVSSSSSAILRFRENKKYSSLKMVRKGPWKLSNKIKLH